VVELLIVCNLYRIQQLQEQCENYIESGIQLDNVTDLLRTVPSRPFKSALTKTPLNVHCDKIMACRDGSPVPDAPPAERGYELSGGPIQGRL
jgi:hypothetical protein